MLFWFPSSYDRSKFNSFRSFCALPIQRKKKTFPLITQIPIRRCFLQSQQSPCQIKYSSCSTRSFIRYQCTSRPGTRFSLRSTFRELARYQTRRPLRQHWIIMIIRRLCSRFTQFENNETHTHSQRSSSDRFE